MLQTRLCVGLVVALLSSTPLASDDCVDEQPNCESWAAAGECKKNAGFMSRACPRSCGTCPPPIDPALLELGPERVVMDIEGYGKVTLGFYPKAAPVTVAHLLSLFRLGCYDSNHIFRVDKGFVAQVQSVSQGSVLSPLSAECAREAAKTVPGEFTGIRHVRGMLSMGRMSDPDSSGPSCSRSRELTRAHPRLGPTRTAAAPPSPCCSAGRRISTASTPCLERCWTATTCSRASRRWRHARRGSL